jgi:transcriptional regulator with XRE-family HTH domain
MLLRRIGEELRIARIAAGLSTRRVGLMVRVSHTQVRRIESGIAPHVDLELLARIASTLGHELSLGVHPIGAPVRDKAHVSLLGRFSARLHPSVHWRTEVPIPIPGDLRTADGVAEGRTFDATIEAETRLDDVQAVERRLRTKQRDLDTKRAILLVADTRHNRAVVRAIPNLSKQFPIGTRACLAALARGEDPGGDCLAIL